MAFPAILSAVPLKYECNRYVKKEYKGFTYVIAENKKEAEIIGYLKFKYELKKEVDYVKCK